MTHSNRLLQIHPRAQPANGRYSSLLSIFMIGNFLWRAFKPGYEWPTRFEQVITIAFDLLCLGSLIGLQLDLGDRAKRCLSEDSAHAAYSAVPKIR